MGLQCDLGIVLAKLEQALRPLISINAGEGRRSNDEPLHQAAAVQALSAGVRSSVEQLQREILERERIREEELRALLTPMSFIYLIALFEGFLTDALETVLVARAEVLRSEKKTMTFREILSFRSMDEIVVYMAQKEALEVSHMSVHHRLKYYNNRFGVNLAACGMDEAAFVRLVADRNVLVHNNGRVNNVYLENVKGSHYKLDDRVVISASQLDSAVRDIHDFAIGLVEQLLTKLKGWDEGHGPTIDRYRL